MGWAGYVVGGEVRWYVRGDLEATVSNTGGGGLLTGFGFCPSPKLLFTGPQIRPPVAVVVVGVLTYF